MTTIIACDWRGQQLEVGDRVIADADSLEGTVDSFFTTRGGVFAWIQLDCDPAGTNRRYAPDTLTKVS